MILVQKITVTEEMFQAYAIRQGYSVDDALKIARKVAQLHPYGLQMTEVCELVTNLAHEMDLPIPRKR